MKTMKTIIAVASLAIGFGLAACDDSELIAPNNMTSGSATKQTLDLDTTAVGGSGQTPVITNGNGTGTGTTNGNGNGNGGGTGPTGP